MSDVCSWHEYILHVSCIEPGSAYANMWTFRIRLWRYQSDPLHDFVTRNVWVSSDVAPQRLLMIHNRQNGESVAIPMGQIRHLRLVPIPPPPTDAPRAVRLTE